MSVSALAHAFAPIYGLLKYRKKRNTTIKTKWYETAAKLLTGHICEFGWHREHNLTWFSCIHDYILCHLPLVFEVYFLICIAPLKSFAFDRTQSKPRTQNNKKPKQKKKQKQNEPKLPAVLKLMDQMCRFPCKCIIRIAILIQRQMVVDGVFSFRSCSSCHCHCSYSGMVCCVFPLAGANVIAKSHSNMMLNGFW